MISIYDELHLTDAGLWLDARRPRSASFISHAHSDHLGAHQTSICTPQTGALARQRLGNTDCGIYEERAYGQQFEVRGVTMCLLPAGHILGSAQLMAETDEGRFVYTGDFKLRAGRTQPPCEVPRCDVLVMECTFGRPHYRFPDRRAVEQQLVETCREALGNGAVPVIYAYALGKAQEIIHVLAEAQLPVMAHGAVANVCETFLALGVDVGPYRRYERSAVPGHVLVVPPETRRMPMIETLPRRVDIAVTGWAMDQSTKFRMGVNVALPYSDHADYAELLEYVERAQPKKVHCVHGFPEFVFHLRREGINAQWLAPNAQLELFR